jgi:hypothetical protein
VWFVATTLACAIATVIVVLPVVSVACLVGGAGCPELFAKSHFCWS